MLLGTALAEAESDLYRSWMHYDVATEPTAGAMHAATGVFGTGEIGGGSTGIQGFFLVPGLLPQRGYASPEIASALVRVVPEPSVVSIAAGALVTMLLGFKKQRDPESSFQVVA